MKGNSKNKVGNKKGGPAYRTPSTFIANQSAQNSFQKGGFKSRPVFGKNNFRKPSV